MAFLNRLLMTATACATTFSALGMVVTAPAQAELLKFSFEGNGVCGYVIYDNSVQDSDALKFNGQYTKAVREYFIDFGKKGVVQGSNSPAALLRVYLRRPGTFGYTPPDDDEFKFFDPISNFGAIFHYPKGTFSESDALPSVLPSTASAELYKSIKRGRGLGAAAFLGNTNIQLVKVSDSQSLPKTSANSPRQCQPALPI